tara:strand:+ start:905 stop:1006 length:102 start_codon:yes stop_codon:yes gene_type:complete
MLCFNPSEMASINLFSDLFEFAFSISISGIYSQ